VVGGGGDVAVAVAEAGPSVFGACEVLDFELEMGIFVGPGNAMGESVPVDAAAGHVFGCVHPKP
jgi:fumarylacetoacetase